MPSIPTALRPSRAALGGVPPPSPPPQQLTRPDATRRLPFTLPLPGALSSCPHAGTPTQPPPVPEGLRGFPPDPPRPPDPPFPRPGRTSHIHGRHGAASARPGSGGGGRSAPPGRAVLARMAAAPLREGAGGRHMPLPRIAVLRAGRGGYGVKS